MDNAKNLKVLQDLASKRHTGRGPYGRRRLVWTIDFENPRFRTISLGIPGIPEQLILEFLGCFFVSAALE